MLLKTDQAKIVDWLTTHGLIEDLFQFIKRPDAFRRLAVGLSGWHWEDEFCLMCRSQGLNWRPASSKTLPYDGFVESLKVQCKVTCDIDRIDLRRRHERRYDTNAFDVMSLKIITESGRDCYFIPVTFMRDVNNPQVLRSSMKIADFGAFKNNWNIFLKSKPADADIHHVLSDTTETNER